MKKEPTSAGSPAATPNGDAIAGMSFEEAYRALEESVGLMETGELALEDALTLYERGVALAKRCDELLTAASLRVRKVDVEGHDAGDLDAGP